MIPPTLLVRVHRNRKQRSRIVSTTAEPLHFEAGQWSKLIHEGTDTDWASGPSLFGILFVIPPQGTYSFAALVHDELYRTGEAEFQGRTTKIDRRTADRLFLLAMEQSGTGKTLRWMIYQMVRLFGGAGWKRYRKQNHGLHTSE